MDSRVHVYTFGCKVNLADSSAIQHGLSGLVGEVPPVHVINTCTVTQTAHQEALALIRRLRRQDPSAVIVVTGCAAQIQPEDFQKTGMVDLVVGNAVKDELPERLINWLKQHQNVLTPQSARPFEEKFNGAKDPQTQTPFESGFRPVTNVWHSSWPKWKDVKPLKPIAGTEKGRRRAFVKIQDGCDQFCAYCVIPWARGLSRSSEPEQILKAVEQLESSGYPEVVLTGVHLADWNYQGMSFEDLVEWLLEKTQTIRFRISSVDPHQITDRFLKLFHHDRLCEQLHLSVQSWDDGVLRDMKRWYQAYHVQEALDRIGSFLPHAFVSLDVIAGFPTEDEGAFERTYVRLMENPVWTKLHVFPYSPRPRTRAAVLAQLPREVVKNRAERLIQLSDGRYWQKAQQQVGQRKWVIPLVRAGWGLSSDYWSIRLPENGNPQSLEWFPVRITQAVWQPKKPYLVAETIA